MSIALSGRRTAFVVAALAIGCNTKYSGGQPPPDALPDCSSPVPACTPDGAPGTTLYTVDLGAGSYDLPGTVLPVDLAADAAGDAFVTRDAGAGFTLTKYAPDGAVVFQRPFGEVVAVDAAGNAYVAGGFNAPIDLGLGTIVPAGDMDVFVAKLAPDGTLLFARALGVCHGSPQAIAVAPDGRIAVSGSGMGTLILDASAGLLFDRPFGGDLAFDSQGNLIVGGAFAGTLDLGYGVTFTTPGDIDGFVVKLDAGGNLLWSYQIGDADLPVTLVPSSVMVSTRTRQLVSAVAVGPGDEVVLSGQFDYDVKLFGTDFVAALVDIASVPLQSGVFVVALDAAGGVKLRSVELGFDGYRDVAVDASGNIVVTGKALGNASPPFRSALLIKLDPAGGTLFARDAGSGAGHAVAVDACSNILWVASVRQGIAGTPPEAYLFKLSP